ncbi:MAG: glycerol-3-phosphate dehydrogenase [Rhodocyclales bacterium RIFCSPLOWO2_02_FULL_63_24]|nr:MAG: glycerol-3-phosphate dehydrogenase [Rhodocyclales bacterium RIFCSPLOWO2_02_FULL_63_24]
MRIAVLGAGAWGTALAIAFAGRHAVTLWARDAARAGEMARQRENLRYLPACRFPDALRVTADIGTALGDADLAILAAPLAGLRFLLERIKTLAPGKPFLWVCKGLEAGTGLLPHQVVAEVMGDAVCGVLTGPSFALEVARGLPTAITLAATDAGFAEAIAQNLHGGNLRVYANQDLIGAEVGGAVKNVLAIATGICDGLGLGFNARAALITRGLVEITRFGEALGARRETFNGLAGMGDLILTCTGELSRNRRVGLLLAEGRALADITRELGHVAEGVPAAREVARRAAELGIEMPITRAVTAVLDGRVTPRAAVEQLMARDPKHE